MVEMGALVKLFYKASLKNMHLGHLISTKYTFFFFFFKRHD